LIRLMDFHYPYYLLKLNNLGGYLVLLLIFKMI